VINTVFLEEGDIGVFLLFLEAFDGVDEEHGNWISATHFRSENCDIKMIVQLRKERLVDLCLLDQLFLVNDDFTLDIHVIRVQHGGIINLG